MTAPEFLTIVQEAFENIETGHYTKDEAIKAIVLSFIEVHDPAVKAKEHLQLFIFRVHSMREQQKKYDSGDYNARVFAKRHENIVDNAINKLVTELGYNIGEITKKYEQQKLL